MKHIFKFVLFCICLTSISFADNVTDSGYIRLDGKSITQKRIPFKFGITLKNETIPGCLKNDAVGVVTGGNSCGGTGTILGTIQDTQLAFGTGVDTIGGSYNLIWNDATTLLEIKSNSIGNDPVLKVEDSFSNARLEVQANGSVFTDFMTWNVATDQIVYFPVSFGVDITGPLVEHNTIVLNRASIGESSGNTFFYGTRLGSNVNIVGALSDVGVNTGGSAYLTGGDGADVLSTAGNAVIDAGFTPGGIQGIVSIAPTNASSVQIGKDTTITGKLTVTGAIDPTYLSLSEQGADPANVANQGIYYTKEIAGVTEPFFEKDDGTVIQLGASSGATIGGTIANTQVAFGTGVDTIGGSNDFSWNGLALTVNGDILANTIADLAANNVIELDDGGGNLIASATQSIELFAANQVILSTPNTQITGTTTLNSLTYTWPGVNAAGALQNDGAGNLSWSSGSVNQVSNSDGTLTISPTSGSVVASLNLAHGNTWTAAQKINVNSSTAFWVEQDGVHDDTLRVDTTNGGVGIGITPGIGFALDVSGTQSNPSARVIRDTGATNSGDSAALRIRDTTTAVTIADGYGPAIDFQAGRTGSSLLDFGQLSYVRDGADNSSKFLLKLYNGGSVITPFTVDHLSRGTFSGAVDITGSSTTALNISNGTTLIVDSTNTRVGIGQAPSTYKLDVFRVSTSSDQTTRLTQQSASTNGVIPPLTLRAWSTGAMADGFATSIDFFNRDNSAVDNNVGELNFIRNGADGTNDFQVLVSNAGVLGKAFSVKNNGQSWFSITPGASAPTIGASTAMSIIADSNAISASINLKHASEDGGASFGPNIVSSRQRGSLGSGGAVQSGDRIFLILSQAFGTSLRTVYQEEVLATQLHSGTVAGTKTVFSSIPQGSVTLGSVMEIWGEGLDVGRTTVPSAKLHLGAGTTTAGTAPLKLVSGTNMTAAEAGAFEFTTDDLFFTITTGTARKNITLWDTLGTSGRVPFATTNGRLADDSDLTFATDTLTATKLSSGTIINTGVIRLKNYTVATLPAGTAGDVAYVTDALGPAFLTIIVGGGAAVSPVFYTGTNWVGF